MQIKKKCIGVLSFIGLIISIGVNITNADTVNKVDSNDVFQGRNANLILSTTPKTYDYSMSEDVETNIPSSRLKMYPKNNKTGYWKDDKGQERHDQKNAIAFAGGIDNGISIVTDTGTVDTGKFNMSNSIYNSYKKGWRSIGFVFSNPTSSDYISVKHNNVGTFKNADGSYVTLDAKVKYHSFVKSSSSIANSYSNYGIDPNHIYLDVNENMTNGYLYNNLANFKIDITFYKQGTNEEYKFEDGAYLTFNSLNKSEGVDYISESSANKQVFTLNQTNIEYSDVFKDINLYPNKVYVGMNNDFIDALGSKNFTNNSVSFQINNKATHQFLVVKEFEAWNTFSAVPLFKPITMPEEVSKTVKDLKGNDINDQTLRRGDTAVWDIEMGTGIIGETVLVPYTQLKIEDAIDTHLSIKNVIVKDGEGNDVTNQGTLKIDGQKVSFIFNNNYLEKLMKYDGSIYHLLVTTTVNQDVSSNTVIPNQASVTCDTQTRKTREPKINVFVPTASTITKSVDKRLVNLNEAFNYMITTQLTDDDISTLSIVDQLKAEMQINSVKVLDSKNTDITAQGTLTTTNNLVKWTANTPNDYKAATLKMVINAQVKSGVDLSQYKVDDKYILGNIATAKVNQTDIPSKNVDVEVEPKGNITIQKLDKTFTTGVANTKFHVAFSDGSPAQDVTTGADGKVTISDVTDGVIVTAVETSVPAPYVLDQTPFKATVKSGETVTMIQTNTIQFKFPRTGSIHLLVSSIAGLFLLGFGFYFYQKKHN